MATLNSQTVLFDQTVTDTSDGVILVTTPSVESYEEVEVAYVTANSTVSGGNLSVTVAHSVDAFGVNAGNIATSSALNADGTETDAVTIAPYRWLRVTVINTLAATSTMDLKVVLLGRIAR